MKNAWLNGFAFLGLLTVSFSANAAKCPFQAGSYPQKIPGIVERVSDGDTVSVNLQDLGKRSIRLLSIDTPELHFPFGGTMHNQGPIAQTASDFLQSRIKVGDTVTVELDAEPCDSYGRILGYIWKGSVNINKLILENSMAVNYCIAPNLKHCALFAKVVEKTAQQGQGVFGVAGLEEPYLWRASLRGEGPNKFVADIRTKKVYAPEAVTQIPVAYRVFFIKETDVKAPYSWAQ